MSHFSSLRGVVYVGFVVLVVAALLSVQSQPALAVQTTFVADDVSITTDDGRITGVFIAPELFVAWQDLDQDAENIDVHVAVSSDGNDWRQVRFDPAEVIYDTAADEKRSGSHTFVLSELNLLEDSSYWSGQSPFSADDFAAASGETTTTTVYVRIDVLTNPTSGTEGTEVTSFDVTVTNDGSGGLGAVITVEGNLNTRVEG